MAKFTELSKDSKPKEQLEYDTGYMKIMNKDGWVYVSESDVVICLPHLEDENLIGLRIEQVPTYDKLDQNKEFLVAVSGTIEKGEDPIETCFRELAEETGIEVYSSYNRMEHLGSMHICKGNTQKVHYYYIPLRNHEYQFNEPTGDGSYHEEIAKTVFVDAKQAHSLKPADVLTDYLLKRFEMIRTPFQLHN